MDKQLRRFCFLWAIFLGVLLQSALYGQSDVSVFPEKPSPAVYVHDYSGWLSASDKSALEYKLRRYWDSTSTQIVVMIRPDLGEWDRASYAFELGNRWGIGRKSKNNGIVVLIKSEAPDRGIFIATGYGTEGALPDGKAGSIIRNVMAPPFRNGQYAQGINAGVDEIIKALSGEFTPDASEKDSSGPDAFFILIIVFIFLFVFMRIIISRARRNADWYTHDGGPINNPNQRRRRGYDPNRSSGGGWWIGGGGGNWGGGGDGGGFGGGDFGGGGFGGGGAGGDW